jgi:hypothetical protein
MPEPLHSADFQPHVYTTFQIESPDLLEVELAAVTDRSNPQVEQFSLLFLGPMSSPLGQGTYAFLHPKMGRQELFIVPIGPRDGKMAYEAVFARPIGKPARP